MIPLDRRNARPGRALTRATARVAALLAVLALALASPARAAGEVFLTVEEALALAFPKAEVERVSLFLEKEETKAIAKRSGEEFDKRLATAYVASDPKTKKVIGRAYFDTHVVRTKRETLMVVASPDGTVLRLEVLAFAEPREYMPRPNWYGQFPGKKLDETLELKRAIKGVTGATLTARATTNAVRLCLAIDEVARKRVAKPPEPKPKPKPKDGGDGTRGDEPDDARLGPRPTATERRP